MYATLRKNQLITPGHNGEQFVASVDGPGFYLVRTCAQRGDVVEFGTGVVEVVAADLSISDRLGAWGLPVEDHSVFIMCSARQLVTF